MIIYKTTNLINNKIYIGQSYKNDPEYLGSGLLIIKAINKYGKENFKKEILEECEKREYLNDREIYWISYYNSSNKSIGYNISLGGEAPMTNLKHSEETKKKISLIKLNPSEEIRKKISDGLKNSIIRKQLYLDPVYLKKLSDGLKNSEIHKTLMKSTEYRKKLSESLKNSEKFQNSIHSEEHGKKISESLKNSEKFQTYIHSEERSILMSKIIKNSEAHKIAMRSKERNKKVSNSLKKYYSIDANRKKQSEALKNSNAHKIVMQSEEYRTKRSEIIKNSEAHKIAMQSKEYSKKMSEAIKNSEAWRNAMNSTEYRKKLSESKMGSKNGMYGKKGKNNHSSKPILQLDINSNIVKEWYNIGEIKELNYNLIKIRKSISDKSIYNGYFWVYKNEYIINNKNYNYGIRSTY